MKSMEKLTSETTLILNEQEKEWLKGLMQNPLHSNEHHKDAAMRERFFHALTAPEPKL